MKRSKSFYLYSIWVGINSKNKSQKDISDELELSKQNLKYYRDILVKRGFIKKGIGYGQWEILKEYDKKELENLGKEVKKTRRIGTQQVEEVKKTKEVRGHAIQIKLFKPKDYRNWEKRREIFDHIGLDWKPHYIGGIERGEIIELDGIKIQFYHKTIVFNFDRKSFESYVAKESQNLGVLSFLKLVKKLERMFNNSPLSHFGRYKFKITRQHYSLVHNALAKQYIDKEKKLHCYAGRGLYLLIDNSFNLEELETVHPDTAVEDNEKVQTFFNEGIDKADLETIKETTPIKIKEAFVESANQIKFLAENQRKATEDIGVFAHEIRTHIPAYEKMGNFTELLYKELKDLKKEIKNLKNKN